MLGLVSIHSRLQDHLHTVAIQILDVTTEILGVTTEILEGGSGEGGKRGRGGCFVYSLQKPQIC